MEGIYLLLGSNLQDKRHQLKIARTLITEQIGEILQASALYSTAPWGISKQPDFINQVIQVAYDGKPHQLLDIVLKLEEEMGRERKEKWGPRIIDIDILLFHDEIIEEENLHIPHPGLPERRFALEPLQEIASENIHPVLGVTISELLEDCPDDLMVTRLED